MAWEWVRQKCWKTKRKWPLFYSVIRKSFIQETGYCWHSAVTSAWPSTCDLCPLMTFPDLCGQACRKFSSRHAVAHPFALRFSPHLSPGRTPFCFLHSVPKLPCLPGDSYQTPVSGPVPILPLCMWALGGLRYPYVSLFLSVLENETSPIPPAHPLTSLPNCLLPLLWWEGHAFCFFH